MTRHLGPHPAPPGLAPIIEIARTPTCGARLVVTRCRCDLPDCPGPWFLADHGAPHFASRSEAEGALAECEKWIGDVADLMARRPPGFASPSSGASRAPWWSDILGPDRTGLVVTRCECDLPYCTGPWALAGIVVRHLASRSEAEGALAEVEQVLDGSCASDGP